MALPARDVRAGDVARQRTSAGLEPTRNGHARPARIHGFLDRHLSKAIFFAHRKAGAENRRAGESQLVSNGPREIASGGSSGSGGSEISRPDGYAPSVSQRADRDRKSTRLNSSH